MSAPPRFIVVDGPDGTGKTTLVRGLAQRLIEAGIPVVPARNPAGTKLGAAIRKATIEVTPEEEPSPLAQFYAQVAATTQLVREKCIPNINNGFVIFDRYLLSLAVYQGIVPRAYLLDFIPRYAQCTAHLPVPGLTIVLGAELPVIMERIASRNAGAASKGRGKKAAPPKDVMETEDRIRGQIEGFNLFQCFISPTQNVMAVDTGTRDETQLLDLVWGTVQRVWAQDFVLAGADTQLQKSRDAVSDFG
jgi:thymidylate kinase